MPNTIAKEILVHEVKSAIDKNVNIKYYQLYSWGFTAFGIVLGIVFKSYIVVFKQFRRLWSYASTWNPQTWTLPMFKNVFLGIKSRLWQSCTQNQNPFSQLFACLFQACRYKALSFNQKEIIDMIHAFRRERFRHAFMVGYIFSTLIGLGLTTKEAYYATLA